MKEQQIQLNEEVQNLREENEELENTANVQDEYNKLYEEYNNLQNNENNKYNQLLKEKNLLVEKLNKLENEKNDYREIKGEKDAKYILKNESNLEIINFSNEFLIKENNNEYQYHWRGIVPKEGKYTMIRMSKKEGIISLENIFKINTLDDSNIKQTIFEVPFTCIGGNNYLIKLLPYSDQTKEINIDKKKKEEAERKKKEEEEKKKKEPVKKKYEVTNNNKGETTNIFKLKKKIYAYETVPKDQLPEGVASMTKSDTIVIEGGKRYKKIIYNKVMLDGTKKTEEVKTCLDN